MDEISTITCPSLTERSVENLHAERIIKLLHFFKYTRQIIMQIACINSSEYEVMKNDILHFIRPAPITVNDQCKSLMHLRANQNKGIFPTELRTLDQALKGGFRGGEIVEIYGMPGSGKTQLCITVAMNCCKVENSLVAYIDTKNGLSGPGFKRRCQSQTILQRFRVFERYDLEGAVQTLTDFNVEMCLGQMSICSKLRVVIIDSLPMLIYPAVSKDMASWRYQLETFVEQIQSLANQGVVVIIVNHAVTAYKKWGRNKLNKPSGIKPAMGKYWSHQPHFRISVSPAKYNEKKLQLTIVKSSRKVSDEPIFIDKTEIGVN